VAAVRDIIRFEFRTLVEVSGDDSFLHARTVVPARHFRIAGSGQDNLHISFFTESYYNLDKDRMERNVVGVMGQWDISQYSLFRLAFQGVQLDFKNSPRERRQEVLFGHDGTFEVCAYLEVHLPVHLTRVGERWRIQPYLSGEYTYNLEQGRGTLNVLNTGIRFFYEDHWTFGLGWRHEDIIHGPDTDQIALSISYRF